MTPHTVVLCQSCRARIVFFRTVTGRQMPVDADSVRPGDSVFNVKHMVSHFATCTNPAAHRKPRNAQ